MMVPPSVGYTTRSRSLALKEQVKRSLPWRNERAIGDKREFYLRHHKAHHRRVLKVKVLVTGAAGFIGGHLVDMLVERGDEVRALVQPGGDTSHLRTLTGIGI